MADTAVDIRTSSLKKPVDVADYLFARLKQLGVDAVHGVPGDYNLVALDYVPRHDLRWVGNVNELNAAYAADGYARVKGIAALVTTFGVGELSALNGVAGAFAEWVPVVHVVGTPSTLSQRDGMLLHHTLGNGDFTVFASMSRGISCATAALNDAANAAELIDHALRECYVQSRPVYVTLPTDMVTKKVEGARLDTPLDLSFPRNDPEQEDYAVSAIMSHLKAAKQPVILVDACAIRHRALHETHELIDASGLPVFVTPMGKGAVDESLPGYGGVYAGSGSHDAVRAAVEASDLVLSIGAIKSDFNTAGFTYRTSQLATVDFHSTLVKVKYSEYHGLRMNGVLSKVSAQLRQSPLSQAARLSPPALPKVADVEDADKADADADQPITHAWLWPHFSAWLRPHDVILTETGTSGYGIWDVVFAQHTQAVSQILWGSIGYATGAAQGACLAARELTDADQAPRRTLLFTGDGSLQLSAQEISTMLRLKLAPVLFVICNSGFTIERFIHGMDAGYNDIAEWRHADLLAAFNKDADYETRRVATRGELRALLEDQAFADSSTKLRLVEVAMPRDDAPRALRVTAEASAANNAKQ